MRMAGLFRESTASAERYLDLSSVSQKIVDKMRGERLIDRLI